MREYRRHLRAGGVIAFHISNQYLDLQPVVGALAADDGDGGAGGELAESARRWESFRRGGCW